MLQKCGSCVVLSVDVKRLNGEFRVLQEALDDTGMEAWLDKEGRRPRRGRNSAQFH